MELCEELSCVFNSVMAPLDRSSSKTSVRDLCFCMYERDLFLELHHSIIIYIMYTNLVFVREPETGDDDREQGAEEGAEEGAVVALEVGTVLTFKVNILQ